MARLRANRGFTRIELVVVVLACLLLLLCMIPALSRLRQHAFDASCRNNLSRIGKAMLAYANDYHGALPRAGGPTSVWGGPVHWNAESRAKAFNLQPDGSGGHATISSSLYLLVKHADVSPKTFVCRTDYGTTPFKLSDVADAPRDYSLRDAWDFGPDAYRRCSYSYHVPYSPYALTTSCDPGMAVAADRSPWIDTPCWPARDIRQFSPDIPAYRGTTEQAREGSSPAHRGDGQHVLFLDGRVVFQKRAYCGIDQDNIYLTAISPNMGTPIGATPSPTVQPTHVTDSVLVHDPPNFASLLPHRTVTHQAREVDSRSLKGTSVVATLDCPLPEHKNAVWCATFQMAWDRLKTDVIGEPIRLTGAEDLASRLNRAAFPVADIEPQSYYANAGLVKDGILEQIQADMTARFPSEPAPSFDRGFRQLPEVVVAYAYLNVDAGFEHPYYTNNRPFSFTASDGLKTDVTSFCSYTSGLDTNLKNVREQVEVLYYEYSDAPDSDEFAVDLCIHTRPYQVILARMPRCATLGEACRVLREETAAFRKDPDYETLRKLRPIDTVVVPDVLYKLTHRFDELLKKRFGNQRWKNHFIFAAMQKIDFTLSRTGVVVKSETVLGAAAGGRSREQLVKPRHLHFDRPFLICVKKREPDATPFFLMWMDNAELMPLVPRDP